MVNWNTLYENLAPYSFPGKEGLQFGSVFKWDSQINQAVFAPAAYDDAAFLSQYTYRVGTTAIGVPVNVAFILVNNVVTTYLYNPVSDIALDNGTTLTLLPAVTLPGYFLPLNDSMIGVIQVQDINAQETLSAVASISNSGVITITLLDPLVIGNNYIIGDTYSVSALIGAYLVQ